MSAVDKPAESAVERWERQYGPGSYGRALNWMACSNVFNAADAALTELRRERDRWEWVAKRSLAGRGSISDVPDVERHPCTVRELLARYDAAHAGEK